LKIDKNLIYSSLISLLLGAFIFVYFFGFEVVKFTNVDYIYSLSKDLALNYIGWIFYRDADWTLPIGVYNSLSYPDYVSILQTDSIPLFAIIFKIFRKILPYDFQYFGLFGLLCFMLQGFFGMLLVRKYCPRNVFGETIAICVGALMVLSSYILMILFHHTSSVSHWIILASYLPFVYFDKFTIKKSSIFYSILAIFAAGINMYMLTFTGIIVCFYAFFILAKHISVKAFIPLLSFCSISLILLFIIGAFVGEFDYFDNLSYISSLNLKNLFLPFSSLNSIILTPFTLYDDYQMNVPAYYGFGCLFIFFVSAILYIYRFICTKTIKITKLHVLVFFLFLSSLILALYTNVTFGDKLLFSYSVPDCVLNLWTTFRVVGRFIFISYYLTILLCIIYLCKTLKEEIVFLLVFLALFLQFLDFTNFRFYAQDKVNVNLSSFSESKLVQTLNTIDKKISIVSIEPLLFKNGTYAMSFLIYQIAYWANSNGCKLSDFYFAHPLKNRLLKYSELQKMKQDNILFFFEVKNILKYKDFVFNTPDCFLYLLDDFQLMLVSFVKIESFEEYRILPDELFGYVNNP